MDRDLYERPEEDDGSDIEAFTVEHILGQLVILGVGITVASITFCIEIFYARYTRVSPTVSG